MFSFTNALGNSYIVVNSKFQLNSIQLNVYNLVVKRPNDLQQAVKMSQRLHIKDLLSKLPIETNSHCRKVFLHDFNRKQSAVLQDVINEIVSDLNRDFKSRFNVNFISKIRKSTKPSNMEKENTTEMIKKDIGNGNKSL